MNNAIPLIFYHCFLRPTNPDFMGISWETTRSNNLRVERVSESRASEICSMSCKQWRSPRGIEMNWGYKPLPKLHVCRVSKTWGIVGIWDVSNSASWWKKSRGFFFKGIQRLVCLLFKEHPPNWTDQQFIPGISKADTTNKSSSESILWFRRLNIAMNIWKMRQETGGTFRTFKNCDQKEMRIPFPRF